MDFFLFARSCRLRWKPTSKEALAKAEKNMLTRKKFTMMLYGKIYINSKNKQKLYADVYNYKSKIKCKIEINKLNI